MRKETPRGFQLTLYLEQGQTVGSTKVPLGTFQIQAEEQGTGPQMEPHVRGSKVTL